MIHLISLGAGVQSSTMALMAAAGEITPMPAAAIFADTQAEPPSVYRWLDWLEKQLPFPVHRVTAGDLEADVLKPRITADGRRYCRTNVPFFTVDNNTEKRGRVSMRSCTKDFKIRPIIKQVRSLVGHAVIRDWYKTHRTETREINTYRKAAAKARKEKRPEPPFPFKAWDVCQQDALVVQYIGISLDEIIRAKPAHDPWIRHQWPLIDLRMRRSSCLLWMERNGYPQPPRSACYFCPFHNNDEWRRLRDEEPVQFEKAGQFEKAVSVNFTSTPYLHRSCKPLDQVDLRTDEERGQRMMQWQDECEGMCGV